MQGGSFKVDIVPNADGWLLPLFLITQNTLNLESYFVILSVTVL